MFGLLNIDKPAGMTSRDVVNRVQKLVRPHKAGHAGTLDPLATGVLVVCVGRATRLISFVQDQLKSYRGTFELGKSSDTDDVEGTIRETGPLRDISREELEAILPEFTGLIAQVPPAFSAVHVDGRRAYDLARRGKPVELAPREVYVASIELTAWDFPRFTLEITCGSGTYIRSIGRDLGARLGCGAVMTALVRTRIGEFRLEEAVALDDLTSETLAARLLPATRAVAQLPSLVCKVVERDLLVNGRGIRRRPDSDGLWTILDGDGELVCLAEWDEAKQLLMPRHVFAEAGKRSDASEERRS